MEYTASAAMPSATVIVDLEQAVEDAKWRHHQLWILPSPSIQVQAAVVIDSGRAEADEDEEGNTRLHFRNQAQGEHMSSETSAIAHWAPSTA